MEVLRSVLQGREDKTVLLEHEVKEILRQAGFSVPKGFFAPKETSWQDILEKASGLTFPLVAKVSSSRIVSKTEVGGVKGGIRDIHSLERAVSEILGIDNSEGVLIEEMVPEGLEMIVGGSIDDQFGPIVMIGPGGIFVEILKDIVFGLAPLQKEEAEWMIKQLRAYPILRGYRGREPFDVDSLIRLTVAVSEMMATGNIKEIDLNPVILYPKGATVVDGKLRIR